MLKRIIIIILITILFYSGFNYKLNADSNLPVIDLPEKYFGFIPGSDINLGTD